MSTRDVRFSIICLCRLISIVSVSCVLIELYVSSCETSVLLYLLITGHYNANMLVKHLIVTQSCSQEFVNVSFSFVIL